MNLDRVAKMNLPSLLTNADWRIRREEILDCLRREELCLDRDYNRCYLNDPSGIVDELLEKINFNIQR